MNNIDWKQEILEYNNSNYRLPLDFVKGENKLYKQHQLYIYAKKIGMPLKKASRVLDVNLSINELSKLEGHLLGDGSLFRLKANRINPVFSVVSKHKTYIEYINNSIDLMRDRPIWVRGQFDQRTNKNYQAFWTRSLAKPCLLSLKDKWYVNDKKIIPRNLILSPELCRRWYMDDGGKASWSGINLATDCFSKLDVEFLSELFQSIDIYPSLHKNGNGFRLYIKKADAVKFIEFIGPCPVDVFKYKWQFE